MQIHVHHHVELSREVRALFDDILRKLGHLENQMSDLSDALDALEAAMTKNNAEIDTLLTKIAAPATPDAEVTAAVDRIRKLTAANTDEVAKAQAAAP